jgi:segregation and condensation protein B
MSESEFKNIIEALIFASEEEISVKQIKEILDSENLKLSVNEIEEIINFLKEEYSSGKKGFELVNVSGGFHFVTRKEYSKFVGKLFEAKQKKRLSQSALETLSIIAYKQPITRSEIEFIRGVNVDYIVNSLLERELITIIGRADSPGRPIIYGTTKDFLKLLGLNSIDDLPKLKEINEILKNEKIEGISEADIELFKSVYDDDSDSGDKEVHQLELLTYEENSRLNESKPGINISDINDTPEKDTTKDTMNNDADEDNDRMHNDG